jgi:anti-sigma regulatory factor (Ser/Thr protein kinase)
MDSLDVCAAKAHDLETAFGEALNNAVIHSHGNCGATIVICIRASAVAQDRTRTMRISVRDFGVGFDARLKTPQVPDDSVDGRGIMLMRALADDVVIESSSTGTVVELTVRVDIGTSAHC